MLTMYRYLNVQLYVDVTNVKFSCSEIKFFSILVGDRSLEGLTVINDDGKK